MSSENNKLIAKNTFFLYLRMLLSMLVALYTARVVLSTLGVNDFGIYNVVGGIVVMFGFISNSMSSASQRFLAFEIGQKNIENLKRTFSVTVTIYILFALITIILAETIGLWFVSTQLNIPITRMHAALWVYQFSILSFIVTILRVPYNSAIIAHERMGFYAWISIVEVVLKLTVVFMLIWFKFDKLILYAILLFIVLTIITIIYKTYCQFKFIECKYRFIWDKELFKTMFNFAGWNLFVSLANLGMNEGINVLLNIFFGSAINAARGIAFQINSQVISFVGNFQVAASPQIIKYYAEDKKPEMKRLLFQSSRLSYYLLFIIALPVLLETDILLKWWLKEVPEYTALFARLVIITTLTDCLSGTIIPAVQATGKIKYYQIFVGSTLLLNLPISYLFLKLGYPPQITMIVSIGLSAIALFIRLYIVRTLLGFKIKDYLNEVVKYNLIITIVSLVIPLYVRIKFDQGIITFLIVGSLCLITTSLSIFYIGLKIRERQKIVLLIKTKIQHLVGNI